MKAVRWLRWLLLLVAIGIVELVTRAGLVDPLTLPPPSEIVAALGQLLRGDEFYGDLGTTAVTVGAAFGIGVVVGVPLGVVFWRLPWFGAVMEPFVVTLYAMPTLVFYPILLAIMGLGPAPIITIAAVMAVIPIALNTMVALRAVPPMLHKLGRSIGCDTGQFYRKVLLPAATPLAIPGLRLGFSYAVIGTIAMEFILAAQGVGFRTGLHYRDFDVSLMYAEVVVIAGLAVVADVVLRAVEHRIRRDML